MSPVRTRRQLLSDAAGVGAAALLTPSLLDQATARAAATRIRAGAHTLVRIPANRGFAFQTTTTNRGSGNARPITSAYFMGTTPVTNAQYARFLGDTGGRAPSYWSGGTHPAGKAAHPVLSVSATQAAAYCAWLTARHPGHRFRLPTEAEWENAAAGPAALTYPWGDEAEVSYAAGSLITRFNYNGVCAAHEIAVGGSASGLSIDATGHVDGWIDHGSRSGFVDGDAYAAIVADGGYTTPVTHYTAGRSHYGLYDMAGNAYEWTASTITASNGLESGRKVRAVRGGSWYAVLGSCRTGYRGEGRDPDGSYATVGFRVAASAA